jgi:hypothetical protein
MLFKLPSHSACKHCEFGSDAILSAERFLFHFRVVNRWVF